MNTSVNQSNKAAVWNFWTELEHCDASQVVGLASRYMSPGMTWFGFDPVNELHGPDAFASTFWAPLRESFPDLRRQTHIFLGGQSNGRVDGDIDHDGHYWVSGTGLFHGRFERDYLGIPATGGEVSIRWGECCRLEQGAITETCFLLDMVDLLRQAGLQVLPPSRGLDGVYPPPIENDGVMLNAVDDAIGAHSLQHIRRFLFEGLNKYDQSDLKSMGMADFFRSDVRWYGPGGIGATLGLKAFEACHQQPWLQAFPDRQVQNLTALFAEGAYSAAPGWSGVRATHTGRYLDCPATGKTIAFNGLDWWKREGEMFVENWVFVDMIHLFRQFGVDLLARVPARR